MSINQKHLELLAKKGIILKKETKAYSVIQLNGYTDEYKISAQLYGAILKASSAPNAYSVELPKLSLGVELEFVGTSITDKLSDFCVDMVLLTNKKFIYTGKYCHNDGKSWILGRDGSIQYVCETSISKPFGYELTTPKLNLSSKVHIGKLRDTIKLIKDHLYGVVNDSCGTHIHIGFKRDDVLNKDMIKLLSYYSEMERHIFDTVVPKHRRRNKYCSKTSAMLRNKYQKLSTRYCNFDVKGNCDKLRFEFRQLEGTLDADTILHWARFQSTIIVDMLNNITNKEYMNSLLEMNIFDILYHYDFSEDLCNFFIDRVLRFKSRTIFN